MQSTRFFSGTVVHNGSVFQAVARRVSHGTWLGDGTPMFSWHQPSTLEKLVRGIRQWACSHQWAEITLEGRIGVIGYDCGRCGALRL